MVRFTIRDVLWLTVVVALVVAWWVDHRRAASATDDLRAATHRVAMDWADETKPARSPHSRLQARRFGSSRFPNRSSATANVRIGRPIGSREVFSPPHPTGLLRARVGRIERMKVREREQASVAFFTFVAVAICVGLILVYVLGIGPATWLLSHGYISDASFDAVYGPPITVVNKSPSVIRSSVVWYVSLWA
jgi:hypothetical protein